MHFSARAPQTLSLRVSILGSATMQTSPVHPDEMGRMHNEILTKMQWIRALELQSLGFDERSAFFFALLESEEKKKLALEVGPHMALLANLTHVIDEKRTWFCEVRYQAPPSDIADRRFHGFQ